MATFTKEIFSGSTNGQPVHITATTGTGTLIHTADAVAIDEVWLYAVNNDTSAQLLTLQIGGTTSANILDINIDPETGLAIVLAGFPLTGGVEVRAISSSASSINVLGFVNRIS